MRYNILDTNVPLHTPKALYAFPNSTVILLATVIEELDSKKREAGEIGANARRVTREIMDLRRGHEGKTSIGIPLENGGTLQIELNHKNPEIMKDKFFSDDTNNDNKILTVVMNLKNEAEEGLTKEKREQLDELLKSFKRGEIVYKEYWKKYYEIAGFIHTLVSNDSLVNIKADLLMLHVQQYNEDRIENIDNIHKGYHDIVVPYELVDKYYKEKELDMRELEPYIKESLGIKENDEVKDFVFQQDFLKLHTEKDNFEKCKAVGRVLKRNGILKLQTLIVLEEMEEAKKEGREWNAPFGLKPRNLEQKMLMEVTLDPNVDMVIALGPAGTGKTIVLTACGLQLVENDKTYNKLIASRPVIPMGKDIGYLPGEKEEKLRSWMQPMYDNLEQLLKNDEKTDKKKTAQIYELIKELNIELEALTYMRGRSLNGSFNMYDEFQNATPHEGKTVVTRSGKGAKQILSGDIYQIDHPYLDSRNNALAYIVERMKKEDNVAIVYLSKTERSRLAEQASRLL